MPATPTNPTPDLLSTSQSTLSTAASLVKAANRARRFVEVKNADAAIAVYIGMDSTLTTSNGHLLKAGESFGLGGYVGAVYAIAASGTPVVTVIEW